MRREGGRREELCERKKGMEADNYRDAHLVVLVLVGRFHLRSDNWSRGDGLLTQPICKCKSRKSDSLIFFVCIVDRIVSAVGWLLK